MEETRLQSPLSLGTAILEAQFPPDRGCRIPRWRRTLRLSRHSTYLNNYDSHIIEGEEVSCPSDDSFYWVMTYDVLSQHIRMFLWSYSYAFLYLDAIILLPDVFSSTRCLLLHGRHCNKSKSEDVFNKYRDTLGGYLKHVFTPFLIVIGIRLLVIFYIREIDFSKNCIRYSKNDLLTCDNSVRSDICWGDKFFDISNWDSEDKSSS